jgi:hypothetical protein
MEIVDVCQAILAGTIRLLSVNEAKLQSPLSAEASPDRPSTDG